MLRARAATAATMNLLMFDSSPAAGGSLVRVAATRGLFDRDNGRPADFFLPFLRFSGLDESALRVGVAGSRGRGCEAGWPGLGTAECCASRSRSPGRLPPAGQVTRGPPGLGPAEAQPTAQPSPGHPPDSPLPLVPAFSALEAWPGLGTSVGSA